MEEQGLPARTARLLLVSFLSLFLELLLIRWICTEVRIFAHLRNLALISCFAGFGIGYALRRWQVSYVVTFSGMALLILASLPLSVAGPWTLKNLARYISMMDVYSWTPSQDLTVVVCGYAALVGVFCLLLLIFVPFGQDLGAIFRKSDNVLRDYTLNVAASLAGILAFTALSALGAGPPVWMACGFLPLLLLIPRNWTGLALCGAALGIMFLVPPTLGAAPFGVVETVWSPYQKIQVWRVEARAAEVGGWSLEPAPQGTHDAGAAVLHMLDVNDIAMMWLLDMSPKEFERHPWLKVPGRIEWYDFPYRLYGAEPERVLIVGCGGGNDTAAALRHGARHVDAVDIDPEIIALGRRYHPEHPYSDPRVRVHVEDARRFFRITQEKYDVITFGQLDNTDYNVMSNFSNIRMDSYMYTIESFRDALRLVKPGGLMVVNFGATSLWGRKVAGLLTEASGQVPMSFENELQLHFKGTQNAYVVGDLDRVTKSAARDSELAAWIKAKQADWKPDPNAPLVTDDWPYWYLARRAVPTLQIITATLIAVISLVLVRVLLPESRRGFHWHFFFLGAAFMLLETLLITRLALFFGSTWTCTAAVISAVLVMIILANMCVHRWPMRVSWCYGGLAVGLGLGWLLPPASLLAMPQAAALLLALLAYVLPVFFAGIIFASTFRACSDADAVLSSNLLGAIFGGLLENLSYIVGMNALLVVVLFLYFLSAVALKKRALPA